MHILSFNLQPFISDHLSGFSPWDIPNFIFSFIVCAILAFLLSKIYVKFGNALSNRKAFARNFIVLAITTMFIISVVKSSLALSLGLVGALSIVRFRAAIKEPEELTYLFLTIAIGLGCGAGMTVLTIIAFIGFVFFIWLSNKAQKAGNGQNLYLSIAGPAALDMNQLVEVLKSYCSAVKLKRSDEASGMAELSFWVEFDNFEKFQEAKTALKKISPDLSITFMDNSRDF